jgi:membrane-associated PAP2 superfamily phosphatase
MRFGRVFEAARFGITTLSEIIKSVRILYCTLCPWALQLVGTSQIMIMLLHSAQHILNSGKVLGGIQK